MSDLYNSVLGAYKQGFSTLSPKAQFHFASRLYLWEQLPFATVWLDRLKPYFTADGNTYDSLARTLNEPLPPMRQTSRYRAQYYSKYPKLRHYNRALFRLLFLQSVYGIDGRPELAKFFSSSELADQRQKLLEDEDALVNLSSFAINFFYLYSNFYLQTETRQPLDYFLELSQKSFRGGDPVEKQLKLYWLTHCIIGETLFYARPIPATDKTIYLGMLKEAEMAIQASFDSIKLDVKFEFLVCCRILNYLSPLQEPILRQAHKALTPVGYIGDPLRPNRSLQNAEHRNALFLMSQRPFQPLGLMA